MIETKTPFEGLAIGGKRVAASDGKDAPAYNPATGEVIAQAAQAAAADVDGAVKLAHANFTANSNLCSSLNNHRALKIS